MGKRVAVNLNYTVSESIINACIEQAGIKRVITSSKAIEKFGIKPKAEMVFLEDFKDKATGADKVAGVLGSKILPAFLVDRMLV